MFKWVGVLLLFFASSAFGFYKAAELKSRQKRLLSICLFIEAASVRIRMGEEIKSIVSSIGGDAGFFAKDYDFFVLPDSLKPADIKLADDFLKGIGMGDTEAELKRCQTYKELFEREYKDAETQMKEKGSLYGKLGVFIGLLIGIVLI